ncbi:hypothetical protein [Thioalkalivibrio sp.]|uniref:hypothetical protein n=1 Tax=Thioalkalivibrio sp. TaxID=2093813 RepID=UPI003566C683
MSAEAPHGGLRVAAVEDDENPAWRSFYPEDLPADWRLAYYAHFWPDLLSPVDHWPSWAADDCRLQEVPEELRLYLEVPARAGADCLRVAARLGERLGGFLFPDAAAEAPLSLEPAKVFRRVEDPVVAGVRSAQAWTNGLETVLVLEPETGLDPRQWRALLESLHAAATPGRDTLAFLRSGPRELEQAQTILRLGGLDWKRD